MTEYLCNECWNGNLDAVIALLPQLSPLGVNGFNSRGQTALYLASRQGNAPIVLALLNFDGFDSLNTQMTGHGSTAAHAACSFGHAAVLALLLTARTSLAIVNSLGLTARQEAMKANVLEVFETFANDPEQLKEMFPICKELKKRKPSKEDTTSSSGTATNPKSRNKSSFIPNPKFEKFIKSDPNSNVKDKKSELKSLLHIVSVLNTKLPDSFQTVFIQDQLPDFVSLQEAIYRAHNKCVIWLTSNIELGMAKSFLDDLLSRESDFAKLGLHVIIITSRTFEEMLQAMRGLQIAPTISTPISPRGARDRERLDRPSVPTLTVNLSTGGLGTNLKRSVSPEPDSEGTLNRISIGKRGVDPAFGSSSSSNSNARNLVSYFQDPSFTSARQICSSFSKRTNSESYLGAFCYVADGMMKFRIDLCKSHDTLSVDSLLYLCTGENYQSLSLAVEKGDFLETNPKSAIRKSDRK